jgi:hypothetical protein
MESQERKMTPQVGTLTSGYLESKQYKAGGQTYASLVCDDEDVLHLVYRDQSHDPKSFDGEYRLNKLAWTCNLKRYDDRSGTLQVRDFSPAVKPKQRQ